MSLLLSNGDRMYGAEITDDGSTYTFIHRHIINVYDDSVIDALVNYIMHNDEEYEVLNIPKSTVQEIVKAGIKEILKKSVDSE